MIIYYSLITDRLTDILYLDIWLPNWLIDHWFIDLFNLKIDTLMDIINILMTFDWLNDGMNEWMVYWLIDWLIEGKDEWMVYWLIDWSIDKLIDWLIERKDDWWKGWMVYLLIDWLKYLNNMVMFCFWMFRKNSLYLNIKNL